MTYDGTANSHLVVSLNCNETVSVMHSGSRSKCNTWINRMARIGRPTHFYLVVTNSLRAVHRITELYN